MTEQQMRARVRYVIGPDGSPLTVADLPPKDTKRWVIRRKAEVVAAVRGGLLSIEEACDRYKLTVDEFLSWQRSIDKHGLPGLRATRVQDYRELEIAIPSAAAIASAPSIRAFCRSRAALRLQAAALPLGAGCTCAFLRLSAGTSAEAFGAASRL